MYECTLGWLVVMRIYVILAVAGDSQSLKSYRRDRESNPGPLAPQAKSLTTTPPCSPDVCTFCGQCALYIEEAITPL